MSKNIVVFSDGTGQAGGVKPDQRLSNIYKLFRASRVDPSNTIDPSVQIAFYDAGLGTEQDAIGFTSMWRFVKKLMGSATGRGISVNVADCYEFIMNHWQPGDRIWIFGFSRGAYTARCVANVLSLCGVPTTEVNGDPLIRFRKSTRKIAEEAVREVYEHGAGHALADFESERDEIAKRFRERYRSEYEGIPNTAPYFIGVFDTVAALGAKGWRRLGITAFLSSLIALPILAVAGLIAVFTDIGFWLSFGLIGLVVTVLVAAKMRDSAARWIKDYPKEGDYSEHQISWRAENYDRSLSGRVMFARHAISIDESRADFPRVKWGRHDVIRKKVDGEPEPLIQLWFAGNHSDIGGSYAENESRLSDIALQWMVEQTQSVPENLIIDHAKLNLFPSADGPQHCEVQSIQDKLSWIPKWCRPGWKEKSRRGSIGAPMHPTVIERFKCETVLKCGSPGLYRPIGLDEDPNLKSFYR